MDVENPPKLGLKILSSSSDPRSTSSEEDLEILYAKFCHHFKLRNEGKESSETAVSGNGSGVYEYQPSQIDEDLELALKEFREDIENEEKLMKWRDEEWGDYDEVHDTSEIVQETYYPTRPNALDCPYYMKTGNCGYNATCRFNHPSDKRKMELENTMEDKELVAYDKFTPKVECKYYQSSAGCKYGSLCKFSHQKVQTGSEVIEMNPMGFPVRHSEKECQHYKCAGSCKFLEKNRSHHPNPAKGENGHRSDAPYIGYAPRSQSLKRSAQWNEYQNYHSSDSNHQSTGSELFELNFMGLPVRHGKKECPHYMRTGFCRYSAKCKFHHPNPTKEAYIRGTPRPQNLQLSSTQGRKYQARVADTLPPYIRGTPRPQNLQLSSTQGKYQGRVICKYYSSNGICKYGSTCKFDHPTSTMFH
ncbi:hypothetical protein ZOSMA_63G00360 [Zostera marina]|uniref:C3H1-type domain-containing protein n=1 Tax=Zostera marina TaxID=29655 RepID=A0A0K9NT15_ZOSMR|nr:hypothetical protein ZOSMA_63G00360 [Zostera marina]